MASARDEVRKNAAAWLMAVRVRLSELRTSVWAMQKAVKDGGGLRADVFDPKRLSELACDIDKADSDLSSMEVLGSMPLTDPVAYARGFEQDRNLFPAEEPDANAPTSTTPSAE